MRGDSILSRCLEPRSYFQSTILYHNSCGFEPLWIRTQPSHESCAIHGSTYLQSCPYLHLLGSLERFIRITRRRAIGVCWTSACYLFLLRLNYCEVNDPSGDCSFLSVLSSLILSGGASSNAFAHVPTLGRTSSRYADW